MSQEWSFRCRILIISRATKARLRTVLWSSFKPTNLPRNILNQNSKSWQETAWRSKLWLRIKNISSSKIAIKNSKTTFQDCKILKWNLMNTCRPNIFIARLLWCRADFGFRVLILLILLSQGPKRRTTSCFWSASQSYRLQSQLPCGDYRADFLSEGEHYHADPISQWSCPFWSHCKKVRNAEFQSDFLRYGDQSVASWLLLTSSSETNEKAVCAYENDPDWQENPSAWKYESLFQ